MTAETAAVLRKARAVIDEPHKWTKRQHARDIDGRPTSCVSETAVCFCTVGAVWRVTNYADTESPPFKALSRAMPGASEFTFIAAWNDAPERTHAEVLAAFDAAIAAEEGTP